MVILLASSCLSVYGKRFVSHYLQSKLCETIYIGTQMQTQHQPLNSVHTGGNLLPILACSFVISSCGQGLEPMNVKA